MNQDRKLGIAVLVGGAVLFWQTFSFPERQHLGFGIGFWPKLQLTLLALMALVLIIRGRLDDGLLDRIRPLAFTLPLVGVGYAWLQDLLGFLLVTPTLLFLGSLALGRSVRPRRLVEAAVLALVGTASIFVIFQRVLKVQLPGGIFG